MEEKQIENQPVNQINTIKTPQEALNTFTELSQTQVPTQNKPQKSKLIHFLIIFILALIVATFAIISLLQKAPDVKAKEYLQAVASDLQTITNKIDYFKGSFIGVSESLQTSKGAFYEITSSIDYFSALEDTKQDIIDINSTLDLIHKVQEAKKQLEVPQELESFDAKLTDYYQKSEESLNLLYSFENFQMTMLEASGINLNNKLKDRYDLVKDPNTDRKKWIEILSDLVNQSNEAVIRFNNINNVPETELDYYGFMNEYHVDLADTMKKLYGYLSLNTKEGDENFIIEVMNFSQRNIERDNARQKSTEEKFDKSKIKELFMEIDLLEKTILAELDILADKYKAVIEENIITPNPTPEISITISPYDLTPTATISAETF